MPAAPAVPWAAVADVTSLLGALPLPAGVSVDAHLTRAHAIAVGWLVGTYGEDVPTFTGAGLELVKTAEASLAAAGVLSALLVRQDAPDYTAVQSWRADAKATLTKVVPGYPVGAVDPDGAGPKVRVVPPPVSSSSRGPYVDDDRPGATGWVNPRTGQLVTGSWG